MKRYCETGRANGFTRALTLPFLLCMLFAGCGGVTSTPVPTPVPTPAETPVSAVDLQLPGQFLAWDNALYMSNGTDAVLCYRGGEVSVYMLADQPSCLFAYEGQVGCLAVEKRDEGFAPSVTGIYWGPQAQVLHTGDISWAGTCEGLLYYLEGNQRLLRANENNPLLEGFFTGAAIMQNKLYAAYNGQLGCYTEQNGFTPLAGNALGLYTAGETLLYTKEEDPSLFCYTEKNGEQHLPAGTQGYFLGENPVFLTGGEELTLLWEEKRIPLPGVRSAVGPFVWNGDAYLFTQGEAYIGPVKVSKMGEVLPLEEGEG